MRNQTIIERALERFTSWIRADDYSWRDVIAAKISTTARRLGIQA